MTLIVAVLGVVGFVTGIFWRRKEPDSKVSAFLIVAGLSAVLPLMADIVAAWVGQDVRHRAVSFMGMAAFIGLCWLLSENRGAISWRVVCWGTGLQIILALVVLKTAPGRALFALLNDGVVAILSYTKAGAGFVFGKELAENNFAFGVLPTIIFFSALMAVLYYLGVMRWVVAAMASLMRRTLGTSGAESLSQAANVFVGQTEAPLVIKPYVATMTKSELLAIMGGGMANTSGGILLAYVSMLVATMPDIAGHLIACSVMTAPAAFVFCKLLLPETGKPETSGDIKPVKTDDVNVIDAFARGASEGLPLVLNVAVMLIAFLTVVPMLNDLWGFLCAKGGALLGVSFARVDTLQELMGYVFYPVAWCLGIPQQDCLAAGTLLGEKTLMNEMIAYGHMGMLLNGQELEGIGSVAFSARSQLILAYALCGFANISSIGIMLGGLTALAPSRRGDLAKLATRALLAGSLATFQTAQIASLLT